MHCKLQNQPISACVSQYCCKKYQMTKLQSHCPDPNSTTSSLPIICIISNTQLFHVDNSPGKMDCRLGNLSCRCRNYYKIKLHATLQLNSSRPSFEIDPNLKHILPPIICVRPDTQLIPIENFQVDRYLNLPIST